MFNNLKVRNKLADLSKIMIPNNENLLIYSISIFYFLNLSLSMIFGRPFVGLMLFGQQLGKIYVFLGAISLILCILINLFKFKSLNNNFKNIIAVTVVILLSSLVSLFSNKFLIDSYIVKTSSYIWSLGYFVMGYYLLKRVNKKVIVFLVFITVFSNYFVTIINYPNFIIDIFISNSDKFQFVKAADVLLNFVILNFVIGNFSKISEKVKFLIFMSSFGLLLPYFIYQSRGSVLASLVFASFFLISQRKFIINNILTSFLYTLLAFILFYSSSYAIAFISVDEEFLPDTFTEANSTIINDVLTEKEPRKGFLTFYIQDGRILSLDATTNWRLDIWQDLIEDLKSKNKIIFGFGYSNPFEIMGDASEPGRLGRDGLNEHVHNYFINILGRGGIVQLILFLTLYMFCFRFWNKIKLGSLSFFMFFIPIAIVSSLDVTMEGVHFPFIFFSFLGYIFSSD
jgi:hypothetical protein